MPCLASPESGPVDSVTDRPSIRRGTEPIGKMSMGKLKGQMNVQAEIDRLKEANQINEENIAWLEKHRVRLEAAPDGSMSSGRLDFDNVPHAEVVKAVRAIGGKWKKSKNDYAGPGKVDYETEFEGKKIRCWAASPPPSCRLVEVEEVIPAQPARVVKKFKMVCKPDLAADIAIARGVPAGTPAPTPEASGGAA